MHVNNMDIAVQIGLLRTKMNACNTKQVSQPNDEEMMAQVFYR